MRWDEELPGSVPKAFRDFQEPTRNPCPHKSLRGGARGYDKEGAPSIGKHPPNLSRVSCPPVMMETAKRGGVGTGASARTGEKHHGESRADQLRHTMKGDKHASPPELSPRSTAMTHISLLKRKPNLERVSAPYSPTTTSPRSPRSPVSYTPPGESLFEKLLHEGGEDTADKEQLKWCERVDSGCLNEHPDDPADLNAWRTGSFTPDDPLHCLHFSMKDRGKM